MILFLGEKKHTFCRSGKRNWFRIPCGLLQRCPLASPYCTKNALLRMHWAPFAFLLPLFQGAFLPLFSLEVLFPARWADMMRFFHHSSVNTSSAIPHMSKGFSSLVFVEFSGASFFFISSPRLDNFPLIPISLCFDTCQRLSRISCHCVPVQDPPKAIAAKYAGCLLSQCSTSILVIHG